MLIREVTVYMLPAFICRCTCNQAPYQLLLCNRHTQSELPAYVSFQTRPLSTSGYTTTGCIPLQNTVQVVGTQRNHHSTTK
jgi:hypothetical protein